MKSFTKNNFVLRYTGTNRRKKAKKITKM